MSQQDQNSQQKFEQQLKGAVQDVSNETTSSKLDQSILAMAEKHHASVEEQGFWNRIFRSKQMKYLVSMSAALVMTVGIARFMVYLGKTDQSMAQNSDIRMAQESVTMSEVADDFAFEMADEVAAAPVRREAYNKKMAEPVAVPELVTNDEMRQILEESDRLAKAEVAKSQVLDDKKMVMPDFKFKKVNTEAASPATSEAEEAEARYAAGVLDEAIEHAPKPQVWLIEIQELLENGQIIQASEEWTQLKNTYPDFVIDTELAVKLEKLGLKTQL